MRTLTKCPPSISTRAPARPSRIDEPRWCGPDRAPLLLTPMAGLTRDQIDTTPRGPLALPLGFSLAVEQPITLGEGCTPLIRGVFAEAEVLLKCEWFNPTGSFKDRGASVMLSLLRSQGIEQRARGQLRQRRRRGIRLRGGRRDGGHDHDARHHQSRPKPCRCARTARRWNWSPAPARTPRMPP